jgi:TRAP transporter 4TM/12TM fusion protein
MEDQDTELTKFKYFSKLTKMILFFLAFIIPVFLIINFNFYPFPLVFSRVFILLAILVIVYIKNPLKITKENPRLNILNYFPLFLIIILALFSYLELDKMSAYFGMNTPLYQIIFGTIGALVLLEGTRRVAGPVLPIMSLTITGYALYKGYSYSRIITEVFSYDGIFGIAFSLAISVVFMFIVFGSFLNNANFGTFLMKFGNSLVGGMSGGPAKVAVLTSSLFGTISGSAVANVVGTGTFTIPMMKKLGFKPEVAAAVEASASTGGQIMPPVMAAAAFLIAEILQVPYLEVIKSALLPAIAFYVCVFLSVDSYSKLKGLKGLPKNKRPKMLESLKVGGHLLIALVILVVLLVLRINPLRAAFLTTVALIPLSFLSKTTRLNFSKIINALVESTQGLLVIGTCTATVGIIIACIGLTGLGGTIASSIVSIGGSNILGVLILVMVTCIIFGMALPTTASYLVLVAIVGPTLIQLGIVPMAAHLFILYFAALSGITPPVALAAYAGAGIANANMMKTALIACKITIVAFIIPYVFVYNPDMIFQGNNSISIFLIVLLYITILPTSLAWGLWGYTSLGKTTLFERIFYLLISVYILYISINHQIYNAKYIIIVWLVFLLFHFLKQGKKKRGLVKEYNLKNN